jgi:hypothetical protein
MYCNQILVVGESSQYLCLLWLPGNFIEPSLPSINHHGDGAIERNVWMIVRSDFVYDDTYNGPQR